MSSFVTQEYFDELCIENYEVFQMNDRMEAVHETLTQLQGSSMIITPNDTTSAAHPIAAGTCSSKSNNHSSMRHLTLTYPDEDGRDIREKICIFLSSLRTIKSYVNIDSTSTSPIKCPYNDVQLELDTIYNQLQSTIDISSSSTSNDVVLLFTNLFLVEDGFKIYFTLLNQIVQQEQKQQKQQQANLLSLWNPSVEIILQTMYHLVSISTDDTDTLSSFQNLAHVGILSLTTLMEEMVDTSIDLIPSSKKIFLILSTIHSSIFHYEGNKKLWIVCQTTTSNFSNILIRALQQQQQQKSTTTENHETSTTTSAQCIICRIVTKLCTFDDFSTNNDSESTISAPVVQTGHSAVQALFQVGCIPIVYQLVLQQCSGNDKGIYLSEIQNDETIVAAFSALRAMAIQDDVVQCMNKIGVIDVAVRVLRDTLTELVPCDHQKRDECQLLVTSIIGLLRNVSANDDIKTTLCIGENSDVVPSTIQAMDIYRTTALLQEHSCGLFAAMALRKPKNATALVTAGAHNSIVNNAMRQHPTSGTVQRQAALAIRNIVSRSPELRPMLLNDCDTEVTLRTIASRHLRCQDEVYAALRDLGLETSSVHVHHAEDGTITVQNGRSTFGVRNPNFRPDFTTSEVPTTSL